MQMRPGQTHCTMYCWLQKLRMHKHEKQPGSRVQLHGRKGKRLLWRWHLGWKAVIKLLLRTVKDYFHFCLLAVLKNLNSHVSLYWWTWKINFVLEINWSFSAGDVFLCVVWHRETTQFWNSAVQKCWKPWPRYLTLLCNSVMVVVFYPV